MKVRINKIGLVWLARCSRGIRSVLCFPINEAAGHQSGPRVLKGGITCRALGRNLLSDDGTWGFPETSWLRFLDLLWCLCMSLRIKMARPPVDSTGEGIKKVKIAASRCSVFWKAIISRQWGVAPGCCRGMHTNTLAPLRIPGEERESERERVASTAEDRNIALLVWTIC